MRILALLVVSLAITFTACSNEESNILGSNPLVTTLTKEGADIVLKGEGKFEKVVTKSLVKTEDCKYIVEGTIKYLLDGEVVAIVDYGNGECDNIATKTVNGETYEIELDKKTKEKESSKWEKNITKPLVKIEGCEYIVEGTIEYLENGVVVATIDFGDGKCDEWATKTWDGGSVVFSIDGGKK